VVAIYFVAGAAAAAAALCSMLPRGVATRWSGVNMSTPLLPEVVPKIDANGYRPTRWLPRDALRCKARSCDRMSSVCPSV